MTQDTNAPGTGPARPSADPAPPPTAPTSGTPDPAAPTGPPTSPPPGRYDHDDPRSVRRFVLVAGSLLGALGIAFAAWFGVHSSSDPVRSADVVSFDVVDSEQVDVTFTVNMVPGTTAVCTLDALAPSYAQVGTLDVTVGPNEDAVATYTVTVRTFELATTGVLEGCVATS